MCEWITTHWGLLAGSIGAPLFLAGVVTVLRIIFSKPKIVFGDPHIHGEPEEGQVFTWYIPVINQRRYGILGDFFKRREAIECCVKVKFMRGGKLLFNYAEHWATPPPGKTLPADSSHNNFPLVSLKRDGHVYLVGTPVSTASRPPCRIYCQDCIIAEVQVISRGKCIGSKKCYIEVDINSNRVSPLLNVRQVDC
jgi:hypothetical protein